MARWKMKSIKHSGTCGERGTDRQEPYYLARGNCEITFDIGHIKIGYPAILYYLPIEDYHGNGIRTSNVVEYHRTANTFVMETENSIFEMIKVKDGDVNT